jgi:thiol-disulfide isomerase/thioredoxin
MNTKVILALLTSGMAVSAMAGNYKVEANLSENEEGAMAYIVNYDNGKKVDSVLVQENKAVFAGAVETPALVRLMIDGNRYGSFILEEGTVTIDPKNRMISSTGQLGQRQDELESKLNDIIMRYRAVAQGEEGDAERKSILGEYNAATEKAFQDNVDNPIGYSLFLDKAMQMNLEELNAELEKYPTLKQYNKIKGIQKAAQAKALTQPGNQYLDFEVTYNGKTTKLSDYVGKGEYVLVDFWASWCGPCIKQTAVIKELYNEYKDKGLKVLGVAVWDEPENTLKGIKSHDLPWEQIINAQTIPTELYGISGIPCIMLFDPNGKILSRDKQDDELKADVKAAMEGTLK